jgi:hypothetical protein
VFDANEALESRVRTLLETGEKRAELCPPGVASDRLRRLLDDLSARWDAVKLRFMEHSNQLSTACDEAQHLHSSLTAMMAWLNELEQSLVGQQPVSRILDNVNQQIAHHQVIILYILN